MATPSPDQNFSPNTVMTLNPATGHLTFRDSLNNLCYRDSNTNYIEAAAPPSNTLPVAMPWLTGTTVPSDTIGVDGQLYLDTVTLAVYEKASGTWGVPIITNFSGLQGSPLLVNTVFVSSSYAGKPSPPCFTTAAAAIGYVQGEGPGPTNKWKVFSDNGVDWSSYDLGVLAADYIYVHTIDEGAL